MALGQRPVLGRKCAREASQTNHGAITAASPCHLVKAHRPLVAQ
jgi:hypothetical protein